MESEEKSEKNKNKSKAKRNMWHHYAHIKHTQEGYTETNF